nr:family 1 glycosylhydrolase [Ktedonobacterales bacterium]
HHGSGPRATSLLDPGFAPGLAAYAAAFARRYPWVTQYTPVNEPLTTARFSGLYGHWYPHQRDEAAMARMVLHQCRAVVLAMAAIRQVQPQAQLIQTEDLGKTHSTPALAYQADFENERRWCSLDLLCGSFDETKLYWHHLRFLGIGAADLAWFTAHPCPPDVMGINHYLTSERFLDEDLARYPAETRGGNGRDRYADVEAVRVGDVALARHAGLLREVWARYQRPLALTEVHLGCDDEAERLRWLWEAWTAAQALQAAGVPMRAITVWALLGSFDWNGLVTRDAGYYEAGAFDVRTSPPHLTALGEMVHQLAHGRAVAKDITQVPGWWRRPERVYYRLPHFAAH